MITHTVSDKNLLDQSQSVDVILFMLQEGFDKKVPKQLQEVMRTNPQIAATMKQQKFTGKALSSLIVPGVKDKRSIYYMFIGLGARDDKKKTPIERYRRAVGKAVKEVKKLKCNSLAFDLLPATLLGITKEYLAQQTAIALCMADYVFDEFITDPERKFPEILDVIVCTDAASKKTVKAGLQAGDCIGHAVNKARHWVDLPPSLLTPPELANKAQEIAKQHNLELTIFDEKQINRMGMGGLAAVSRGSDLDCRLVVMRYKAKRKTAPTLVFVGKGITFDSGGLSLKPAHAMESMKEDMSGASAVIAAMNAIAELKPNVNVIAVTPLAENLPSGKAAKPGDIVRFYNGKTAEIKNTDAEGRLILADALAYAVKQFKPDAIIDLATLTGACQYALGPFYSGLMSQHDDLAKKIEQAAERSGDRVWPLPLDDDYKPAICSQVADISNIGSPKYYAGVITAGFFLQNFVGDTPWAHLDLAGTAFNVPDIPYYTSGATGVGVRLLVDLAINW